MRPALFAAAAILCGCTQFPELDRATSDAAQAADYPALVDVDPIIANAAAAQATAQDTTQALESRAAALKARADRLRRIRVVDPATRSRMTDGVS